MAVRDKLALGRRRDGRAHCDVEVSAATTAMDRYRNGEEGEALVVAGLSADTGRRRIGISRRGDSWWASRSGFRFVGLRVSGRVGRPSRPSCPVTHVCGIEILQPAHEPRKTVDPGMNALELLEFYADPASGSWQEVDYRPFPLGRHWPRRQSSHGITPRAGGGSDYDVVVGGACWWCGRGLNRCGAS